jgi:hypothetical protein
VTAARRLLTYAISSAASNNNALWLTDRSTSLYTRGNPSKALGLAHLFYLQRVTSVSARRPGGEVVADLADRMALTGEPDSSTSSSCGDHAPAVPESGSVDLAIAAADGTHTISEIAVLGRPVSVVRSGGAGLNVLPTALRVLTRNWSRRAVCRAGCDRHPGGP